jgi:hypothetical protein
MSYKKYWIGLKYNFDLSGFTSVPAILATNKDMLLAENQTLVLELVDSSQFQQAISLLKELEEEFEVINKNKIRDFLKRIEDI